ncbi:MAG: spore germination protein [Clostridia bacterium]|nr:spore germination protein [Clostridia bacterium]
MAVTNSFSDNFTQNINMLDSKLRLKESFDIVGRDILVGGKKRIRLYFIDGFCKDELMERVMAYLMQIKEKEFLSKKTAREFADAFIPYVETDVAGKPEDFIKYVLSGGIGLIADGFCEGIIVDARTYPVRSMSEPENDRVLRGPHDGFVETLVFNSALIRRRIRDTSLTMELFTVGESSKTDVVVCYMKGNVSDKALNTLRRKLNDIKVNSLTLGQQSLVECLVTKQRFNPFPKVRYTERPDAAAACVLEGSIILLTDNSPAAMIIPSGIFDFLQDTNDFYMSPLIGSYLRIIRMFVFALTLLLIPLWYLLIRNPEYIPQWLDFIRIEEPNSVPIIAQLFIVEIVIDTIRLASINTPQALSGSFGIIGALVLGEFAVSAGWFVPEVVLYMAFVAMTNFTQPSFELGYAFKLLRMMLLGLTALFNAWGFLAGVVIIALEIAFNKTVTGQSFLYPLIPLNIKALKSLIFRMPINSSKN